MSEEKCEYYLRANFYNSEGECSNGYSRKMCADVSDCYYKQLQTAKEENKRLNKANNDLINDTAKAIGNYDKLQHDLKVAREALKEFVQFRNKYKHTKINEGSLREYSKIADRIEATLSEISEVEQ